MTEFNAEQHQISQISGMFDDGLIMAKRDGVILSTNAAATRYFGKNLIGRSIFDVIEDAEFTTLFAATIGTAETVEMRYEPSHAVRREFRVRIKQLDDGSVALLFLDMTLQRNLEKVRRDFVANVSHELRSPLTSVVGFIETLLTDEVADRAMRTRFLEIMNEEAKRMTRLIDDLLSLSQVEVEEHIVPDQTVNLSELLCAVKDSLAGRATAKGMRIIIEQHSPADNSEPLSILGNHDEITEVFVNLLENAIKYGFDASDIVLCVRVVPTQQVQIDVTNQGDGIENHHLARLTERFYRVDKARSRQIGGTGLGLAIVKHIINRHRGSLNVTSTLGESTTFSVILPRLSPETG